MLLGRDLIEILFTKVEGSLKIFKYNFILF